MTRCLIYGIAHKWSGTLEPVKYEKEDILIYE